MSRRPKNLRTKLSRVPKPSQHTPKVENPHSVSVIDDGGGEGTSLESFGLKRCCAQKVTGTVGLSVCTTGGDGTGCTRASEGSTAATLEVTAAAETEPWRGHVHSHSSGLGGGCGVTFGGGGNGATVGRGGGNMTVKTASVGGFLTPLQILMMVCQMPNRKPKASCRLCTGWGATSVSRACRRVHVHPGSAHRMFD